MSSWSNWAGNVDMTPVGVLRPHTPSELADLVAEAARAGRRVRPVGSGHSFTAIAAPADLQLSLEHLSGVLSADRETGRVRVLAGTPLRTLTRALDALGLAMPNLGDIDAQTISGALSTGTHGTGRPCRDWPRPRSVCAWSPRTGGTAGSTPRTPSSSVPPDSVWAPSAS